MNRRNFLKGAAVGAMGLGAASVLGACSPKAPGEKESAGSAPAANGDLALNEQLADTKWAFEIAPDPIPEDQISETVEAEIVVIGAGTAGLCTALSAVEQGADVLLISASTGPIARGGSNHAIKSKVLDAAGIPPYDFETALARERLLAGNLMDQEKWSRIFNNNEEAMNWVIEKMEAAGIAMVIESAAPESVFPPGDVQYMPPVAHSAMDDEHAAGGGQPLIVKTLAEDLTAKGGKILYRIKAVQLVRDDNNTGRVSAVIAQDMETEKYIRYAASKAIVLATGDFSADRDMLRKYCPSVLPLVLEDAGEDYDAGRIQNGLYKGDGHKMGLWVGAAWQRNVPNCSMVLVPMGGPTVSQPYCGHIGLVLNAEGKRYSNEHANITYAATALMNQTVWESHPIWGTNFAVDNGTWYDRGVYGKTEKTPEAVIAGWEKLVENKAAVKGDTLEEVVEQLELPKETALASIARYNELCEKGHDDDFFKRADLMVPIKEGPFYGSTVRPSMLTVLGGLRCNVDLQVCDENDEPIEGLYEVGTMIGDLYSNVYTFLLEGINYGGACITYGYLLGKQLAAL